MPARKSLASRIRNRFRRATKSKFEGFPKEIQLKILEAFDEGSRLIEIRHSKIRSKNLGQRIPAFYSPHCLPPALHVSVLWRQEMMKRYVWSFGVQGAEGDPWRDRVLVNWEKDVVYFPHRGAREAFDEGGEALQDGTEILELRVRGVENIQKIAAVVCAVMPDYPMRLQRWRSLQQVTIVCASRFAGREPVLRLADDIGPVQLQSAWQRFAYEDPPGDLRTFTRPDGTEVVYNTGWVERGGKPRFRDRMRDALDYGRRPI